MSGAVVQGGTLRYRQDENGDYVYHPNGTYQMTQQEAADKTAANRAARNQTNAAATGGIALQPVGGSGSYGGGSGSGSSYGTSYGGGGGSTVTGNPGSTVNSPGSGGGDVNLSRPGYEDQQMLLLRAKLNDEAYAKRLAAMSTMGNTSPHVGGSGGPMGNEEQARSVAFARAKDRAGQTAMASLASLQNVLNNRGMFGGTEEARLTQQGLQGGADVINEFSRDELMTDLNRAAEIGDRNYAGDVTQRGQDMNAKQSLLALINSAGLY